MKRSLRVRVLRKSIKEHTMNGHDFETLNILLNYIVAYIQYCDVATIPAALIAIKTRLERLVGTLYREPKDVDMGKDELYDQIHAHAYGMPKSSISEADEIKEISNSVLALFEKRKSPEQLTFESSSSSTSPLTPFSESSSSPILPTANDGTGTST